MRSGISVELGIAMMVLAVVWSILSREVLRYQLRLGTALYDLPRRTCPGQGRRIHRRFLRILLFLLGLIIVLVRLMLR